MIAVRPALAADAAAIGVVHVAAWRSAYAGILPDHYLANMSAVREASYYFRNITAGAPTVVATSGARVVGFATMGPARSRLADGEVETLYVLDDFREQGAGRALMQRAASSLAASGCRSLFLWVLRDNPYRWFYQRLGGRPVLQDVARVAGATIPKTAYVWDPIDILLPTPASSQGPTE